MSFGVGRSWGVELSVEFGVISACGDKWRYVNTDRGEDVEMEDLNADAVKFSMRADEESMYAAEVTTERNNAFGANLPVAFADLEFPSGEGAMIPSE